VADALDNFENMTEPNTQVEDQIIASNEFQRSAMQHKLNWLRAGVLGANDGIASTAGLIFGVAGSGAGQSEILVAGVAALVAGSLSMAGGEYTSVSAQRDSEVAAIARERKELEEQPEFELRELAWFYEEKGLSPVLAMQVAEEVTAKDALKAHAEAELGISHDDHVSPTAAAVSSFFAFAVGSLLPLLTVSAIPVAEARIPATIAAVAMALALTGFVAAKVGEAKPLRSVLRNVIVSLLTMGVTYGIGALVGTSIA
jgi:VIT1/CCC1 family predicted Fe2+/Mn2+ transporter